VDSAVELAKRFRGGAAAGLVNAVLRRAASGWQDVELPSPESDVSGALAVRLSHPRWLVEEWVRRHGVGDTEALLRANNEPAPTVLRVNQRRIDRAQLLARLHEAGYSALPAAYSPVGICVESAGSPATIPGYTEGHFSVQGEASQLVTFLAAPKAGDTVLDLCAAPGGKATHLAELMDDRGDIVALDTNARGIARLQSSTHRLGLSAVRTMVADATAAPGLPVADCVLVDAPCSGLGTLRQHPEVKWRRAPDDSARLAGVQGALLACAARLVRPHGTLVYATCTLTAAEND